MAEVAFTRSSISNMLIGPGAVRTVAAITAAYVATSHVRCGELDEVTVGLTIAKGDETSIEVIAETSNDGGSTWYPVQVMDETLAAGVAVMAPDTKQIVVSTLAATDYAGFVVDVRGWDAVRLKMKATGGTPTGTVIANIWGALHRSAA